MTSKEIIDGRRQRGQNNRARIVKAVLELTREGVFTPSAEQVARRAAVSPRTVFRHFADMDSLYREVSQPIESELREIAGRPFRSDDWRERLMELVERRCEAFDRIAPFRRAAEAQRHRSEFLEQSSLQLASVSRGILEGVLPEASHQSDIFEAIDMLLSFPAWNRLRSEQGLNNKRACDVLKAAVAKIAGQVG